MASQLALYQPPKARCTFENYIVGSNANAVLALKSIAPGASVFLAGEDVGVTHLLRAAIAGYERSLYVNKIDASALMGLETMQCVAIDNIEQINNDELAQQALFHAFNRARDAGVALVLGANSLPEQFCQLPDLLTRLRWGLVFELVPLDGEGKGEMLRSLESQFKITLPQALARTVSRFGANKMTRAVCALAEYVGTNGKWPRSVKSVMPD